VRASASVVAAGDSTMITLGSDTIIIRSVEVVLREIELKRVDVPECRTHSPATTRARIRDRARLVSLRLATRRRPR
jgi:hypothetical protein